MKEENNTFQKTFSGLKRSMKKNFLLEHDLTK